MSQRALEQAARRVLVVDDDADWRNLLRECLEELGYEAVEAEDGQQALERLEESGYRVMLLDLYMPGMDGWQVLERLPPDGPRVVFLTGAGVADVGRALRQGAHYYLPKGAGRNELSLLLESLEA